MKRRRQEEDELDNGSEPDEEPAGAGRRGGQPEPPSGSEEESSDLGSDEHSDDDSDSDGGVEVTLGQLVGSLQDGSTASAAAKVRARARAVAQRPPPPEPGQPAAGADAPTAAEARRMRFKREGKHRPVEASSKRKVSVFRDVFQAGSREVRDPRFESLTAGPVVEEQYKKRYAFLYDDHLPQEKKELAAGLKKVKSASRREQLQRRLARVDQQLRAEQQRRSRDQTEQAVKARERDAVRAGKRPFYPKRSEQRKQELLARYQELKTSGKLEAYMAKRRRRNAAKDHRYVPSGRRDSAE